MIPSGAGGARIKYEGLIGISRIQVEPRLEGVLILEHVVFVCQDVF